MEESIGGIVTQRMFEVGVEQEVGIDKGSHDSDRSRHGESARSAFRACARLRRSIGALR